MKSATDSNGEASSSRANMEPSSSERQPLLSRSSKQRRNKYPVDNENSHHGSSTLADPDASLDNHLSDYCRLRFCLVFIILVGLCFLFAIVLLLSAPGFAQRSFDNDVQLSFQQANIINITEQDDTNIITMHVTGDLYLRDTAYYLKNKANWLFGDVGIHNSTLEVYHESKGAKKDQVYGPMGVIHLPPLSLSREAEKTEFDFVTRFVVDDVDALTAFCKDAVKAKTVSWRVMGPMKLSMGWLPFDTKFNLDKMIALDGMNGLKTAELKSVNFPGPHRLGGIALTGAVGIYNPSAMLGLSIGDVDFAIFLPAKTEDQNDTLIGVVRAHEAKLMSQRMNYFNISGRSFLLDEDDPWTQKQMGDFLTAYLHGNSSVIRVQGSPYGPDDELGKRKLSSVPEWLRKALASIAIDIPFPGTNHTDLIQSLELENIKMDFSRSGNPLISGDAVAMLKKPEEMQFPMDVTQIHPTVFIYLRPDSEKPFARLAPEDPSPATTLDGDSADNDLPCGTMKVISKVHRAPFKVEPGGEKEFEQFLHKVFYGTRAKVYIRGVSDASVDSAFGHLVIKDLEFNGTIDTKGMEGMVDPPPAVSSMEIIKGYPDALHVQTQLMIESPADVNINLGALNILLLYKNEPIGNGSIAEFKLAPGRQNRLTCSVWLHGDDPHSRMNVVDFVGQYLGNDGNTSLTISGDHPNATQAPLLRAFFKQLRFVVQPPPFHESPLLKNVQMNILSSTTVMYLQNPFNGVQLEIVKLNASASYGIHEIGTVKANFADKGEGWDGPIVLPPPSCENSNCTEVVIETPKIPVVTKKLGMDAIKKALNGEITVSVDSNVTVNVDAFVLQDLKYKRDNITAKVRKGF